MKFSIKHMFLAIFMTSGMSLFAAEGDLREVSIDELRALVTQSEQAREAVYRECEKLMGRCAILETQLGPLCLGTEEYNKINKLLVEIRSKLKQVWKAQSKAQSECLLYLIALRDAEIAAKLGVKFRKRVLFS